MFTEINRVEDLEPGMLYEGRVHRCGRYNRYDYILRFSLAKEPELQVSSDGTKSWIVYIATPIGDFGEGYDIMTVIRMVIDEVYAIKVLETYAFDIKLNERNPMFSTLTYKHEILEKRGENRKPHSWMPLHEKQKARVAAGLSPYEKAPDPPKVKKRWINNIYDARPKDANRVFLCIFIWILAFIHADFVPICTGVTLYNLIMLFRWLYFGED